MSIQRISTSHYVSALNEVGSRSRISARDGNFIRGSILDDVMESEDPRAAADKLWGLARSELRGRLTSAQYNGLADEVFKWAAWCTIEQSIKEQDFCDKVPEIIRCADKALGVRPGRFLVRSVEASKQTGADGARRAYRHLFWESYDVVVRAGRKSARINALRFRDKRCREFVRVAQLPMKSVVERELKRASGAKRIRIDEELINADGSEIVYRIRTGLSGRANQRWEGQVVRARRAANGRWYFRRGEESASEGAAA